MTVLLVDVANVVGSRPDGWWRDRVGATERLLDRLAGLPGSALRGPGGEPVDCAEVVAVVEGAARQARAPEAITVVRADGSGDDAVVTVAAEFTVRGRDVLVVTADRGLRARLPAETTVTGPSWLRGLVE